MTLSPRSAEANSLAITSSSRRNGTLPQGKQRKSGAQYRSPIDGSFPPLDVNQSQCDHAFPSSSCFFLASASMRILAEHSSQIVFSDVLPQILQTCLACSGLSGAGLLAFTGISFHCQTWAGIETSDLLTLRVQYIAKRYKVKLPGMYSGLIQESSR